MQLDISRGVDKLTARILYLGEINSLPLERLWQRNDVLVLKAARFLQVEISRAGGGTEKAFPEARPFLVGPIHQADRDRRLSVGFGLDPTQDLQAGQRV